MAETQPQETAFPKFIDPKDETVEGMFVGFSEAPTKFGDAVVVEIRLPSGEHRALWLNTTVLRSQFARLRPEVGERIGVEYLGLREGAKGSYHDFWLSAPDRKPYAPNWDAIAGEQIADEGRSA